MAWCPENLAIVDNNIAAIENGSFSPCGDTILTLNLRNAGIMVIGDGAFDEFSKTVTLDLRNNTVKEIQEGIVKGMTNIATIYFQNNHHHHNHLPPWIRSFDLFRHRHIAIISWGVHSLFFLEVCS